MISEDGGMLHQELEKFAVNLVNEPDLEKAINNLNKEFAEYYGAKNVKQNDTGVLFIGNDTRPSANSIKSLIKMGSNTVNPSVNIYDFNEVTTPMLHHHVDLYNNAILLEQDQSLELSKSYMLLNEAYFAKFGLMFKKIIELKAPSKSVNNELIIDCANGVGSIITKRLFQSH